MSTLPIGTSNWDDRDVSNPNSSLPGSETMLTTLFHELINEEYWYPPSPANLKDRLTSQSNSYEIIPLALLEVAPADSPNHVSPSARFPPTPPGPFSPDTINQSSIQESVLAASEKNKTVVSSRPTVFASLEEACQTFQRNDIQPRDTTLPSSPAEEQECVAKLTTAFKSLHRAIDNQRAKDSFKKANYDHRMVELACWKLLEAIVDRQVRGPFDVPHVKSPASTFAQRFNDAERSLYLSKCICKRLLDPPYLHKFVNNPILARKQVASNKKVNDQKSKQIKAGQKALSQ
ncbi:hypothetical protein N7456_012833 [Penicillium angulare]|uniref:Uncharacterized protein n=1 Tax=Penicillium angulare TaxID=116970 RepID=A0A9W9EKA8_9EURO|nr:hypothetical protein N7456_012833 [Penicillium angulare]